MLFLKVCMTKIVYYVTISITHGEGKTKGKNHKDLYNKKIHAFANNFQQGVTKMYASFFLTIYRNRLQQQEKGFDSYYKINSAPICII